MKKICFVTTISATLQSFVLPFAKYLREQEEYDITFICDKDDNFAESLPPYIHYIPISMRRGIRLDGINAIIKMMHIFRYEKFDLIQYSTPNAAFYAALAAKLAGVPIRKYHLMGFRYLGFRGLLRFIFKKVEQFTCAISTDIECVSESNRTLGIKERIFSPDASHVILHGSSVGVDCARFDIRQKSKWRKERRKELQYNDNDCVFGYVGRITRDKGINELVSAFASIERENARLLLIGDIDQTNAIDSVQQDQLQKNPWITCHSAVDNIEEYYSALDILVLPSYREGFGMVVVEAEAMGLPVIVTDIPGPTDAMVPGKTGLLVKKKDTDSLVRAMRLLVDDLPMRKRFGEAAHEFAVENFDQKRLFQAFLEDLRRLLSKE